MAGAAGNGDRVYVQAGDVVRLRLPWSEVCIHMRVAGKPMNIQVVVEGTSAVAQLLTDDGTRFSFPHPPRRGRHLHRRRRQSLRPRSQGHHPRRRARQPLMSSTPVPSTSGATTVAGSIYIQ